MVIYIFKMFCVRKKVDIEPNNSKKTIDAIVWAACSCAVMPNVLISHTLLQKCGCKNRPKCHLNTGTDQIFISVLPCEFSDSLVITSLCAILFSIIIHSNLASYRPPIPGVRVRVRVNPSGPPEWRTGIILHYHYYAINIKFSVIIFNDEICSKQNRQP